MDVELVQDEQRHLVSGRMSDVDGADQLPLEPEMNVKVPDADVATRGAGSSPTQTEDFLCGALRTPVCT